MKLTGRPGAAVPALMLSVARRGTAAAGRTIALPLGNHYIRVGWQRRQGRISGMGIVCYDLWSSDQPPPAKARKLSKESLTLARAPLDHFFGLDSPNTVADRRALAGVRTDWSRSAAASHIASIRLDRLRAAHRERRNAALQNSHDGAGLQPE